MLEPPVEQLIPLPALLASTLGSPEAPRRTVEKIIEALIASLDTADGDPDMEEDDPPGQHDEDEFNTALSVAKYTPGAHGAGCPLSDGGGDQYC